MPHSSTPRARKPARAEAFTRLLLAWYARAARDLPWRRTRDPYKVLVSEFMLQQTQVSRVADYYPRFLARFPNLSSLARAPARQVRRPARGRTVKPGTAASATRSLLPRIWDLARVLVPRNGKRAWRFNQAMMELGAVICVARRPKCPRCPVRTACRTGARALA